MPKAKKHHYVPQFLLEYFISSGAKHVYVFDKWTDEVWQSSVRDAGSQNKFNTFQFRGAEFSSEDSLSELETLASPIVQKIHSTLTIHCLTLDERAILSKFVAAQMLRVPAFDSATRQLEGHLRTFVAAQGGKLEDMFGSSTPEDSDPKVFRAKFMQTELPVIAKILFAKRWALMVAADSENLLISDAPVAKQNTLAVEDRGNLGIACKGIEIYLPLGRQVVLAMICPTVESELKSGIKRLRKNLGRYGPDRSRAETICAEMSKSLKEITGRRAVPLNLENVINLNSLQVIGSERFLYSANDDFALARDMISSHPDLRRPPRLAVA